jgi:CHASE3 domain sensor protein
MDVITARHFLLVIQLVTNEVSLGLSGHDPFLLFGEDRYEWLYDYAQMLFDVSDDDLVEAIETFSASMDRLQVSALSKDRVLEELLRRLAGLQKDLWEEMGH